MGKLRRPGLNSSLPRYHQLELQSALQFQGPGVFLRKDVAEQLKITDDQKNKIEDIQQKSREEMQGIFQGQNFRDMSPEDRQKLMTRMQEMRKATTDKVMAVLTDDQKNQWKEMVGAPFTFPTPQRRPRGAGGQAA